MQIVLQYLFQLLTSNYIMYFGAYVLLLLSLYQRRRINYFYYYYYYYYHRIAEIASFVVMATELDSKIGIAQA